MATVMTSADGKRRCDGTCHLATHQKCTCICGGKFHGASVRRDMTSERRDIDIIVAYNASQKKPRTVSTGNEERCSNQPGLFEEDNASRQEV